LISAAKTLSCYPFIIKPNRGGKGLGVQLFHTLQALQSFCEKVSIEDISLDGIVLVQQYIKPFQSRIIRMEFIDSKFYYALGVDTSEGFELCPADQCEIGDAVCPVGEMGSYQKKFQIIKRLDIPEIKPCESFLRENDIRVAGIEYLEDEQGQRYFYDINTNTNYNREAERLAGIEQFAMDKLAFFLNEQLQKRESSFSKQSIS
jgi:hypothetical protein